MVSPSQRPIPPQMLTIQPTIDENAIPPLSPSLNTSTPSTGSPKVTHRLGGEDFLLGAIVEGELPSASALEDGTPGTPIIFGADKDYTLAAFALEDAVVVPRFRTMLHIGSLRVSGSWRPKQFHTPTSSVQRERGLASGNLWLTYSFLAALGLSF